MPNSQIQGMPDSSKLKHSVNSVCQIPSSKGVKGESENSKELEPKRLKRPQTTENVYQSKFTSIPNRNQSSLMNRMAQ